VSKKRFNQYLGYLVERPFFAVLYVLLRIAPLSCFLRAGNILGALVTRLVPGHRHRIINNLTRAYGNTISRFEKELISRDVTINLFKNFLEVSYTVHRDNQPVLITAIRLQGKEHLDKALQKGKGVIAVSAHQGNFSIMGLKMRAEGYPFHTVIREISNPYRNSLYARYQKHLGQSFIPSRSLKHVMRNILPALRRNEIILLIADEHRRHGGIAVTFFDHEDLIAPGPAVLSLRTGAPIVPMFMIRHQDDTHTLAIQPPLELPTEKDPRDAAAAITQMIMSCIEQQVRAYPSQWFWTQRRWQARSD